MNGGSVSLAKFDFKGIDDYTVALGRIGGKNTISILKYALYPGASVVADALRAEIESNHKDSGDLADSLSLATMRNDSGYINTKIVFADYDRKGVANALKAAALESGTSRGQQATHFISRTVKAVTDRAETEISKALDQKIAEIMGE